MTSSLKSPSLMKCEKEVKAGDIYRLLARPHPDTVAKELREGSPKGIKVWFAIGGQQIVQHGKHQEGGEGI